MDFNLPKYAVFDMDGTLIDNYEYHLKAWGAMCEELGAPRSREEVIRDLHGTNFEICKKFFGPHITFEESERIGETKEARYREIYRPHIQPVAGLVELLKLLISAGTKLAVGTMGNRANAQFVLDELQLHTYFSAVHTAEEVSKGKPDPEIFNLCLDSLGADTATTTKEDIWIFEDTSSGIGSAVNAGGTAIGIITSRSAEELESYGAAHTSADYEMFMKLLTRAS